MLSGFTTFSVRIPSGRRRSRSRGIDDLNIMHLWLARKHLLHWRRKNQLPSAYSDSIFYQEQFCLQSASVDARWSEHDASVTRKKAFVRFSKKIELAACVDIIFFPSEQLSGNLHLSTPAVTILQVSHLSWTKKPPAVSTGMTNGVSKIASSIAPNCPFCVGFNWSNFSHNPIHPFLSFTGNFSHQQGDGTSFSHCANGTVKRLWNQPGCWKLLSCICQLGH